MDRTDDRVRAAAERARLVHELNTSLTVLAGRLQLWRRRARRTHQEVALPTPEEIEVMEEALVRLAEAVTAVDRELARLG